MAQFPRKKSFFFLIFAPTKKLQLAKTSLELGMKRNRAKKERKKKKKKKKRKKKLG